MPYLLTTTKYAKQGDEVPFNMLTSGTFRYFENGNISTVFKRDDKSITIKRHDGWLVTVKDGDFSWNKLIIKL